MYKCPKCDDSLRWVGDEDNGERAWGFYECEPCQVEVTMYFDDYDEDMDATWR